MEKMSKLHSEAFNEDDSQLKEFAIDCFDRVLIRIEDSLAIQKNNCGKQYFPLCFHKVND